MTKKKPIKRGKKTKSKKTVSKKPAKKVEKKSSSKPKGKKKVLIVEDERVLLTALSNKFTLEGFDVEMASNGQEGLNKALAEHPDMILMDILMPVMDGMTMLEQLRKDTWGKNAEVIILTNLADTGSVSEALDRGTFDFLVKSDWKMEEIVKKVREKLA
ncbi:response regulator [Patescibacteria group bacterium]|nr:response regulator [Patescibacteria group bacterium]MBU1673542.1 response regulator [Patescibacteria group bacterium]MBU1963620.1 response regulator [Patescibacteria group bacterium]